MIETSLKDIIPTNYELLFSQSEIQNRIKELGQMIYNDFKGAKPILVGVLNGAALFLADLIRNINTDLEIDFIRISSYGDHRESTGHVKILKPLSADIVGRNVVIVEDIVDSGISIRFLEKMMLAFNPTKLKFATLLHKSAKTIEDVTLDYVGFDIEDKYVVGYGLDDKQFKRNLQDIYVLKG